MSKRALSHYFKPLYCYPLFTQVAALFVIVFIGAMSVTTTYINYGNSVSRFGKEQHWAHDMMVALLEMRRNEKDYMLRGNTLYLDDFKEQRLHFESLSTKLLASNHDVISQHQSTLAAFYNYANTFHQAAALMNEIGMSEEYGLLDNALNNTEDLLGFAGRYDNSEIESEVLLLQQMYMLFYQAQRAVLLSPMTQHMQRIEKLVNAADINADDKQIMLRILDELTAKTENLIAARKTLGQDYQEGLQNEFRIYGGEVQRRLRVLMTAISDNHQKTHKLLRWLMVASFVISVGLVLFTLYTMFHNIFRSVNKLSEHTQRSHNQADYINTAAFPSPDFKALANYMNLMLHAREDAKNELKASMSKISALNKELSLTIDLDPLTGIANRRCFDRAIEYEFMRAKRDKTPLGLIMIDIDHFKTYNDTYGHQGGDAALKRIALSLSSVLSRSSDLVARYGGEEFAVILPNTDRCGVAHVAKKLHNHLRSMAIPHKSSPKEQITLSSGSYCDTPKQNQTFEVWIEKADIRLYKAKETGRDKHLNN